MRSRSCGMQISLKQKKDNKKTLLTDFHFEKDIFLENFKTHSIDCNALTPEVDFTKAKRHWRTAFGKKLQFDFTIN